MDLLTAPRVPNAMPPTAVLAMTEEAGAPATPPDLFTGLLAEAIATLHPEAGLRAEGDIDPDETTFAEFQAPPEAGSLLSLMQPSSVVVPIPAATPIAAEARTIEAAAAISVTPSLLLGGDSLAASVTSPTPAPAPAGAQPILDQDSAPESVPTRAAGIVNPAGTASTESPDIADHLPQAGEAMTAEPDVKPAGDDSKTASPAIAQETPAATATQPSTAPKPVTAMAPSAPTAATAPQQPVAEDLRDLSPAAIVQASEVGAVTTVAAKPRAQGPRGTTTLPTPSPAASPTAEATPQGLTPLMPEAMIEGAETAHVSSQHAEAPILLPEEKARHPDAAGINVPIDPPTSRPAELHQADQAAEATTGPAPAAASTAPNGAPPAPTAPRPAGPVAWPARQIAPFAIALAMGPDASLTVTLNPVELGRVQVSIERTGSEAAIRITAERPETLALLQRDSRELERALADAGLAEGGTSMSFSLGGGDASQQQARQAAQRRNGLAAPSPLAASVPRLPPQHADHRRGLLDLAI